MTKINGCEIHFNVRPRYTQNSPGQVNQRTATLVAVQEKTAHQRAIAGRYGVENQRRAASQGCGPVADSEGDLRGIVEIVAEHAGHFVVLCMLTGRRWRRRFPGRVDAGKHCAACQRLAATDVASNAVMVIPGRWEALRF